MKPASRDLDGFIRKPDPAARAILIYGPDNGLVRERAAIAGRTVVADLNDPFNAVTLPASVLAQDPARLMDEALAFSMLGGARLIRVEDADDTLMLLFKDYLSHPSLQNLVVLEAGNLAKKSTLRALFEKSPHAAAIPCYVDDERALPSLIADMLRAESHAIEQDALVWLARNIAGDRQRIRTEIEKIATYMGPAEDKRKITLEDAQACCGEAGTESLDELVRAVAGSQTALAMAYYAKLLQEGTSPVAILRVLQAHFRKLHLAAARMEQGMPADRAAAMVSPPLFFKNLDAFTTQLRQWSPAQIEKMLQRLTALEAQTKQTGVPVETLCGQAVLSFSRVKRG